MSRREFLDRRREICRRRFDELHAQVYDDRWGSYINATHREFVDALVTATPDDASLVDIACGTGKYWPILLDAGRRVVGVDQSAGMLARANEKYPDVPTYHLSLQELHSLTQRFDGLLCCTTTRITTSRRPTRCWRGWRRLGSA